MNPIRKASTADLPRVAEIMVFNYRLNFYPIFKNDEFYFHTLQVPQVMTWFEKALGNIRVYDDGAVKGFVHVENREIKKLFVEPVLQGLGIGSELLRYAVDVQGANTLWALEKNTRAIAFYRRHGFRMTGDRKPEEGTAEFLVRLER